MTKRKVLFACPYLLCVYPACLRGTEEQKFCHPSCSNEVEKARRAELRKLQFLPATRSPEEAR